MPNSARRQSLYITGGNPDTYNDPTLYAPGELGQVFDANDFRYQLVQVDSSATAATATGVVAANQVAFWKDRINYIVTNNSPAARLGQTANAYRNEVAGIFPGAKTAGYFCLIKKAGPGVLCKSDGNGAIGDTAIANSGTAADVTNVAAGTAATYMRLGTITAAAAAGNIAVDLDIPDIP